MKENELRVGNYVFSGVGGNVRVDEIRYDVGVGYVVRMYLRRGEDHESWWDLRVSDAEPILLTPELLEKCGFSKESEYVYRHDEFGDHVLYDAPTDWGNTSEYPVEIDGWGGRCTIWVLSRIGRHQNAISSRPAKQVFCDYGPGAWNKTIVTWNR